MKTFIICVLMSLGLLMYAPRTHALTPTPTPRPANADGNGDGRVDEGDYAIWLSNYAPNTTQPDGPSRGDFTGDRMVDGVDYVFWLSLYNTVVASPTIVISPHISTPTPTTSGPTPTSLPQGAAVGYGRNTVGGTGGTVTNVSTFDALKTCIAGSARRICKITGSAIFDGRGAELTISHPNITIDGTGSTVIFKDTWIRVLASEVILRNLRVRTGDLNVNAQDADAISINGGTGGGISNILVDHVEADWGPDVVFTILNNVSDITVQHSIVGGGLSKSAHPEANEDIDGHNLSFNISGITSSAWPKRVTIYRNLITGAEGRYTRTMGSESVDIINNVYYNFDDSPHGNPRSLNFVNNILRWGPAPQAAGLGNPENFLWKPETSADFPNMFSNTVYESGNIADGFTGVRGSPSSQFRTSPAQPYSVQPESTTGLFDRVLNDVGPDIRDAMTNQWISEARNKTGKYYNGDGYPAPNPHWP